MAKADLVFVADVVEASFVARKNEQGIPYPDGNANYRFNVLESFKGIDKGEFRAQYYFGGGSDLDSFASGHRYVIFANRAASGTYKSGCSLTREISRTTESARWTTMRAELNLCPKKP